MSTESVVAGDCIFYVKELLSKDFCRTAIESYERDPRRHAGNTVGSRGEKKFYDDVKVSTDLGIVNAGVWTAVHEQLHQAVSLVVASISNGISMRSGLARGIDSWRWSSFLTLSQRGAKPAFIGRT